MTVLAYITDLFFQSKVAETAKQSGAKLQLIRSLYELFPALEKKPEVVLIDLEADGIDGPALISQLKGSYPDLKVIAYGAHVRKKLLDQARESGADAVFARSKFTKELPNLLSSVK